LAKNNRLNNDKLKKEVVNTTKKDKAKECKIFLDIDETNIASSSKLKKLKHKDHGKSEKEIRKEKEKIQIDQEREKTKKIL